MTDPTARSPSAGLPAARFSESDTDAILRRAAELASGAEETAERRGLTLPEMEALANEAGLDPDLVRRAAREVTLRQAAEPSRWAGAPRRILLERVLPRELTEEGWEAMVGEIQRTLGGMGFASQVGRNRSWTVAPMGTRTPHSRVVSITANSQQGKTVLRIEESLSQLAGAMFGGLMGGLGGGLTGLWMGIGMGVFHSPVAAVGLILMGIGGSYTLARTLFIRAWTRRTRELNDLLDRLAVAGNR